MKTDWVCTDADNEQYGRQISEKVFDFKELNRGLLGYEEGEFIYLRINLNEYSRKQILNHILAYYDSIEQIETLYGDDSNWIIAECIFEQESGLY